MTGKTHQIIGATASIIISSIAIQTGHLNLPMAFTVVAGSSLGSFIPDMDHTGSTLGKKIAIISHPVNLLSKMFLNLHKKTKSKICLKIGEIFAHRGIFHAPIFWAILILLAQFGTSSISNDIVRTPLLGILTGIAIGIFMHLFADMFNPTGVPLLMPILNRKISIGNITTGSWKENLILISCIGITIIGVTLSTKLL